ncbi:hypothetical protein [Marinobacter sp. MBR-105]|jgi:hypothetical protein
MGNVIAVLAILALSSGAIAGENQRIEKTFTDSEGNNVKAEVVYQKAGDNKVKIVEVRPIDASVAFFDRACEQRLGKGARFVAPGPNTKIIVGDVEQYTFGCQNETN